MSNPNIDPNDEIVFMAKDAGGAGPAVRAARRVWSTAPACRCGSPTRSTAGAVGYVYLFRHTGGLSPGAGKNYVTYNFNLLSGNYKTTYKLQDGPNPENSLVSTGKYTHHFGDRWLSDRLTITVQGGSGADILDRHKALFAPGNCARSEDTFDDAEGAFIVNKDGPVRAIRSYVGANSGPSTERTHIFYRAPGGHRHRPAGARDRQRDGLLRLQPGGVGHEVLQRAQPGRHDDRRQFHAEHHARPGRTGSGSPARRAVW